jgi:MFS transporter, DHA3 family, tetracycline resistance protein
VIAVRSKRLPAAPVYLVMRGAGTAFDALVFTLVAVYYVKEGGFNAVQLVLVGTVMESAAFLLEIPTGIVADVYSRRLSIIIGVVLMGLAYLLVGSFALFPTVLLAQVVWSAGYTCTSGATEAWVADELGEERAAGLYLRATQAAQIGTLFGTVGAVALAEFGLQWPIIAGGLCMIGMGIALAFVMPERGFTPLPREERNSWQMMAHTASEGFGLIRRRPILRDLMLIGLFFGLWSEGFDRLWEAHFLNEMQFPTLGGFDQNFWFGFIRVGIVVLAIAATELVRRKLDATNHRAAVRSLFLINALLVASLALFGVAQSFGLAVGAFWAAAVLRRITYPISIGLMNQSIEPGVRATVLSARGQVDSLGQTIAGPFLGILGARVSTGAVMVAAAVILSPVLPLYVRLFKRR